MLNKTISLFSFDELSQDAKNKVIEKNRYINVDFNDWYAGIFENFILKAKKYGLDIEYKKIDFSGFWSQGDGASFTCEYIDTKTLIDKFDIKFKGDKLKKEFCECVGFTIDRISTRYFHAYTVKSSYVIDDWGLNSKTEEYFYELANEVCEKLNALKNNLCGELYGELEKEYFELTSDEMVAEAVNEQEDLYFKNGMLFTAEVLMG